jgi:mannuronan 5-epimerase
MEQLLRTFLILVLNLIVIAPFLIISITAAATTEKFSNILYDTQSVSFFSVNQSRADEQEIHPTNNSSCVNYDNRTMTINICGGMVDLTALNSIINNSKVLNQTSPKNWFLNANISIAKGATLFINSSDTDWLKINSTAGTAYSIVAKGNLLIDNTKISSWNFTNKADTLLDSKTEPRSYLVVPWDSSGQMNITNSNLSYLGYDGGKDTGGISYYAGDGSVISNNHFSFNYVGLDVSGDVSDIIFANNTINNSYLDGLIAETNSTNLEISNNAIYNNTNDGIVCTELCKNILVKNNSVYNNTGNGILLNQSAVDSEIKDNGVYYNGRSGITLLNSSKNVITNNTIDGNFFGITLTQSSGDNAVQQNTINNTLLNGISLYEHANNNTLRNNIITESLGSGIYIQGKGTSNNIFIKNNVIKGASYGIQFLNASNNILLDNTIANNSNSNYYGKSGSTNTISDTKFNHTTIAVSDDNSMFVLGHTDNRISGVSSRGIVNMAYPTNTTILIPPVGKNVILDTYEMNVIPSSNNVNISAFNDNFKSNETYKKWSEISSPALPVTTTRYTIGGFEPNKQIVINVNGSFWNAYTSNSSGYITFLYNDNNINNIINNNNNNNNGYYTVKRFEAEASNAPALAAILFLVIIVIGLLTLLFIIRQRKKVNSIYKHQVA